MTIHHDDGLIRCAWCGVKDPQYIAYHDQEWGVPEWDDRALFEKLVLDGFQAGLSWITILRKRENFRTAFDGFDDVSCYIGVKCRAPMAAARFTVLPDVGVVRI